jgi:5'-deoxynucleotidase YfbR-like HD superfamily hydrolase
MNHDPSIVTYSGRKFPILRATASDIFIEDIAHALSNICRYTGHCKKLYSVAEHSVRIANMCTGNTMKLYALLHDAPEAYLSDLSTPVKEQLPRYQEIEKYLQDVIIKRYSLECVAYNGNARDVKEYDTLIRVVEVKSLFKSYPGFNFQGRDYEIKRSERIRPWSSRKAEKEYLKLFKTVYRGVYREKILNEIYLHRGDKLEHKPEQMLGQMSEQGSPRKLNIYGRLLQEFIEMSKRKGE